MSGHFKEYCPFGQIVRQCRCPGGTKTIVPCPPNHNHPEKDKYPSCPCDRVTCGGPMAIASIGCVYCGGYSHTTSEHESYVKDHSDYKAYRGQRAS